MGRLKFLKIITFLFLSSASAFAQINNSACSGEYFYEGEYGSTYGGSPILVEYTVTIDDNSCEIEINGFQVSDDIICIQEYAKSSITLLFKSYASGDLVNSHGAEIYHPNQPLLKFENVKNNNMTIMKTYWLGITDPDNKQPKAGVYFKRTKR